MLVYQRVTTIGGTHFSFMIMGGRVKIDSETDTRHSCHDDVLVVLPLSERIREKCQLHVKDLPRWVAFLGI